jgi:hypothetical protein
MAYPKVIQPWKAGQMGSENRNDNLACVSCLPLTNHSISNMICGESVNELWQGRQPKCYLSTDTDPMEPKEPFDFEAFKQEAIKGLYAGQSINGERKASSPLC